MNTYTAVIKKDNGWWIGWIEEVPGVNCQEATREELLETLRTTLKEALEFNRQDAIDAAESKTGAVQEYEQSPVFSPDEIAIFPFRSYAVEN